MESVIQTQVLGVTSRPVNGGRTIYEVQAGDGNKYSTFKPDVAQKAANFQGQMADLLVAVQQKGNYTNFYINDAGPVGTLTASNPTQGTPIGGGNITPVGGSAGGPGVITPVSGGGSRGMNDEDRLRMARCSSSSTAFAFVAALYQGAGPEALKDALKMARGLAEGVLQWNQQGLWPGGVQVTPLDVPPPETPQEVAGQVPGVRVGVEGVVASGGDDIPWD